MKGPIVALAVMAVLAAGCATRGSVRQLGNDLASLRADVTELRRSQELSTRELGRTVSEVRTLTDRSAELQASLREIAAEAARLRARAEQAERELQDTKAAVAAAAAPPERGRMEPPPAGEAEQAYSAAMATFRAREHGQAVLDFLDFIAKYPKHPLAANAQYWIGEAYYVQRDYRQALVEFGKVLETAPRSPKAADALLKLGLCQSSLREHARAQQTWERVISEYAGSEAANKARTLLRQRTARS